jgi:hypothetical protein
MGFAVEFSEQSTFRSGVFFAIVEEGLRYEFHSGFGFLIFILMVLRHAGNTRYLYL